MKRITILALVVVVSMFLFSCGGEKKPEPQPPSETPSLNISADMLASTTDPVCGMTMTQETLKDTAVYQGKLYGFCSTEEKAQFKQDPEKYLAAMKEAGGEHPTGEPMEEEHPEGKEPM